jgi:hypothetical protein
MGVSKVKNATEAADAERIVRWIREHDPAPSGGVTDGEFTALRERLRSADGTAGRARAGRPRRIGLTVGGALATLVVAVGAPALAISLFNAQTGFVVPSSDTENAPGNELIDLTADDTVEYAQAVFPYDLPVPDGVDIDDVRVFETARILERTEGYDPDVSILTGDQTIVEQFAVAVWCLWADELKQSTASGDTDTAARAREVIVSAPEWDAVANPGSIVHGVPLKGYFGIAASNAERGATSVHRFLGSAAVFSCGPHATLDEYRGN